MLSQTILETATDGNREVPPDWMPAGQVRPFIFEDPVVVWLRYHGEEHGFQPDTSPYEFLDFIGEKGRQFEEKWTQEMAIGAVRVCRQAYDVRQVEKVQETIELMLRGTPIIVQPALWWAPERVYGVPDLLVHTTWLEEKFPELLGEVGRHDNAPNLQDAGIKGHYVVLDIKFTTKLDNQKDRGKVKSLKNYSAQVRIYSYILGHLQGLMPQRAFLITRDRIESPLPVAISSKLNQPLDSDLTAFRDQFVEIKVNGAIYTPWDNEIVASNIAHRNDLWVSAKKIIAKDKIPGRDPGLLYQIGPVAKRDLANLGFVNLDSMLQIDPGNIPFEQCRGLGAARSRQIRAILEANQSGSSVLPSAGLIPSRKSFEFYIDFEFFTNVNVDFEKQWPTLDGCEMVFMVGVGWEEEGRWSFETFVATVEDQDKEREMFENLIDFLQARTDGGLIDDASTALYHWTSAEVEHARRASDRHQYPNDHILRNLPWVDLQRVFLNGPCCVPGALTFGLKELTRALGQLDQEYDPQWPGDLDEGLRAMVMGWRAYETSNPLQSPEMSTMTQYLEADCKALWKILKWLRS